MVAGGTLVIGAGLRLDQDMTAASASDRLSHAETVLTAVGFGIDEVTLTGHRFTDDRDIFDALDLANVKTMPGLRSAAVQARLQKLPWIATASLTRVYPGRIDVVVTERTPFAVWTRGTAAMLIDATGRELSAVRPTELTALPRIAGEGAPEAAFALFEMLAHVPQIKARVQWATRMTGRRWSLQLDHGVRLDLPPEGEATALEGLLAEPAFAALLGQSDTIIDLRSRTRIAARPAGGL